MAKEVAVATPVDKERLKLFRQMTPATQEVAETFQSKLGMANRGVVLIQYDLGARVKEAIENEDEYGSGAVEQLAAYLAIPGGATVLYNLRNFATVFSREYVEAYSDKPMKGGEYLKLGHWFQLMRIEEEKPRQKMLDKVIINGMSTNELEREMKASGKGKNKRAGGRKPAVPSSGIACVQKMFELSQKFTNFANEAEDGMFEDLKAITMESVDEKFVEKLESAAESASETEKKASKLATKLEAAVVRAKKLLAKKDKAAAAEYNEGDDDKEEKKPKASKNGKPKKARPVAAE